MNLVDRINKHGGNLSNTEKYCLDNIINNESMVKVTIQQLADSLNVSTTTIFRMVKKLEYKSFNDFKDDLLLNKTLTLENSLIPDEDDEIINNLSRQYLQTLQLMKSVDFDPIVKNIKESKNVLICAMGMTHYIARVLEIKIKLNGINSRHFSDPWFMKLEANSMGEGDMLIILSKTGETKEIIEVANIAKLNKCKILFIGEVGKSTIKEMSDYFIPVANTENIGLDLDTRLQIHVATNYLMKKIYK
ncbi:MurR/RpiR family transcriptional regulator [Romboutsia sp.]|uniref:MurR/RpiR family transcriptional regulator n=1 Tax=Romboutsia sp. TaxID=1965302 RepID=UPI003F2B2D92